MMKRSICLLGVAACVLCARADGEYGLVEAVVAAATVDASYEPFRPDAPVTLAGSYVGSVRGHNGITNTTVCWAPTDVYTRERWASPAITNKFTGLTPNATYRFELHGSENNWSSATGRDFNLFLQNVQVLTNFNEVVEFGHKTPYVRAFETQANANGEILAAFTKANYDVPHYCGLAIFGTAAPSAIKNLSVNREGSKLHCTWARSKDVLRYYLQGRPSGTTVWQPLVTLYGDVTAFDAEGLDLSTDWDVRLTASNGVGVASSEVRGGAAFPVYTLNCHFGQAFVGTFCPADYLSCTNRGFTAHFYSTSTPPDGVNPGAPLEVTTTTLYGKHFRFTLPNLRADKTYELKVWHSESYNIYTNGGDRIWSVAANGTILRDNVDSYLLTGGINKLGVLSIPGISPDSQNRIVVDLTAIKDNVSPLAIALCEENSDGLPLVPAVEVTAVSNIHAHATFVKPHYGTGDLLYTVRRKAVGADDATAEVLASDIPNRVVIDTGVSDGYVYSVRAANGSGASDWSPWQEPTTTRFSYKGIHMNRGVTTSIAGGLFGPFDSVTTVLTPKDYSMSSGNVAHDVTRAWEPAPQEVYTRQLYANTLCVTVTNLVPGARYRVRIHSSEDYSGANANEKRKFECRVNDSLVFNGLDLWKETQKLNRVIIKDGYATASADGMLTYRFGIGIDNASIAAVECILDYADDTPGLVTRTVDDVQQSQGAISVPTEGAYTFTLSPSSAFSLWVDELAVVKNTTSGSVTLPAGKHEIFVRHAAGAQLRWSGPGLSERALDAPFTSHVGGTDMDIAPWQEVQVGNPSNPGYVTRRYDRVKQEHSLYVLAAGADIWSTTDQEKLAYQEIPGSRDFTMTAYLQDTTIKHNNAKVGIEFRSSTNTVANNYLYTLAYSVGLRKIVVSGGDFTDGSTVNITEPYSGEANIVPPIWFKWEVKSATGPRIATGYTSNDGVTWTQRFTKQIPYTKNVYVGVNVCSHDVLGGSLFRDLTLEVAPPKGTILYFR